MFGKIKRRINPKLNDNQEGYVLMGVIIFLALALFVSANMLSLTGSFMQTRATVNKHDEYYYDVEEVMGNITAWMQSNSKKLITAFLSANFSTNFDTGTPSLGANEGVYFGVPTMIKIKGTGDSALLSNNSSFGTGNFPTVTDLDTGAAFDPLADFQAQDFGDTDARVTLVWARDAGGDYEPVFRIDVLTDSDPTKGVHSFSYVETTLESTVTSGSSKFYGRDYVTTQGGNNTIASRTWTWDAGSSSWSKGALAANALVTSNSSLNFKSLISGNVKVNGAVVYGNSNASISGSVCEGAGCDATAMPTCTTWASVCGSSHQGNLTVSVDTTLSSGATTLSQCWDTVTVDNNKTLTFDTVDYPYYIKKIVLKGDMDFAVVSDASDPYELYFDTIANGTGGSAQHKFTGNDIVNTTNAPHKVIINYAGTNKLSVSGNSDLAFYLNACDANVDLGGNFIFEGGIIAEGVAFKSNSLAVNDEQGIFPGTPVIDNMNFTLKKASQRYR